MPELPRDSIHPTPAALDSDEKIVATFAADRGTYWRSHGVMALVGSAVAGGALVVLGNPYPWVGPVAAVLAIAVRAAYLRSEAFAEDWRMTSRRLLGPGGRIVLLGQVKAAHKFLDAVQVVTRTGDKHLIKYQADPRATAAAILAARDGRRAG